MTHAASRNTSTDMDSIKDSAVAVKDAVTDLAAETGKFASHRIADAKDVAAGMVDAAKSKASDVNDSIVMYIKKNPYKSIAMAAGAGLMVGFLLRRR